jgi:sec-independent protein translocase protein TatB
VFNIGAGELLVILGVALLVLGPDRLPEAVRTAGRVMGEVRRITGSFQQELRSALDEPDPADDAEPVDEADEVDEVDESEQESEPDEAAA